MAQVAHNINLLRSLPKNRSVFQLAVLVYMPPGTVFSLPARRRRLRRSSSYLDPTTELRLTREAADEDREPDEPVEDDDPAEANGDDELSEQLAAKSLSLQMAATGMTHYAPGAIYD